MHANGQSIEHDKRSAGAPEIAFISRAINLTIFDGASEQSVERSMRSIQRVEHKAKVSLLLAK